MILTRENVVERVRSAGLRDEAELLERIRDEAAIQTAFFAAYKAEIEELTRRLSVLEA